MKKRGSRIALKGGHEFYQKGYSKGGNFQAAVEVWRRHNLPWNEKENTKSDPAAEFETALGWLNEWNFTPDKKLHMPKKIRMWMEVASLLVTEDMIEDFLPWNYVEKESLTLAPPPEPSPD